jgi:hypothetical protein
MSTVQGVLQQRGVERRKIGRTRINRSALLFFTGRTGVYSCCVRDVTNQGAGIRLEGLNILPVAFDVIRQLPNRPRMPNDLAGR